MIKYIKTEDGYKNPKSLKLSKFTNDLYGNQLILSLAGTPSGDEIEESYNDSRATYFDQYIGFNSEKLDNFDLRDTDFLCTLKLGNQTFTFSRDNTTVYNDSPGNDAADEYYLEYGSWDEKNWDFSDGASPLYCLEMDLYRSDEEPYYWLNVYGHVNDSVADSISFTYDIIEREPKKIPKEYLEITKLSDLDNDLYGCDEYVSLAQITDDQWVDEMGLHRYENWIGVGPCHRWHVQGKRSFTEVNIKYDLNSIFDLSQTDFLVTMKVGDETVKISASDFAVSNRSSTDFMGDYGFEQSDIHDESFDIDAALIKPVCQLWLRLYVLNDKMRVSIEAHTNNPDTFVTFDFIEKQTKKIPEDYLNLSNIQSAVDAAQTTADGKMDANNPIGTGSFSMNRTNDVYIGTNSTTIGTSNVAKAANQLTTGQYNAYSNISYIPDKLKSYASLKSILIYHNRHNVWYSKKCYITDNNSGILEDAKYLYFTSNASDIRNQMLELYNEIGAFWFGLHTSLTEDHEGYTFDIFYYDGTIDPSNNADRAEYRLYRLADFDSKPITHEANNYSFIVGNGTSDTERSNAHTLDWNGNAWYSGDVYTGSTSGKNKDEGSKKLATEEYTDNVAASKITAPTTAAIGQTIRVSEVDNTGKPTAWEAVEFPEGDTVNTGRVLAKVSFTEEATGITVTDLNADITELTVVFKATTGVYAPTFSVNNHKFKCYTGSWDGSYCYVFVRIDKEAGKILLKYKAANGGVQSNEQTWNENEIVESVGIDALGFAANDYFNVYEGLNALLLKETYIWLP